MARFTRFDGIQGWRLAAMTHATRLFALLTCGILAVMTAVPAAEPAAGGKPAEKHALVGKAAPDITFPTADGKAVKLADLKGKVVVLDFWATWCAPCIKGLPHIQALSQKKELAERGLVVLAVNFTETKEDFEPFLKKNGYTFTVPMDPEGKHLEAFQAPGVPLTVVIGRDGTVRTVFTGLADAAALDAAIEAALK
jgi:peroxiredoxin